MKKESIKVKIAKMTMNIRPSVPRYDIAHPRSETINHKDFISSSEDVKRRILFEMAKNHYIADQTFPYDHFFDFFDVSLKELLSGKKVLDLGCGCGGKAVSWAERWNVNSMYGVEINKYFIEAATLFSSKRKNKDIDYNFTVGVGEKLPFNDNNFDFIVSFDVLEHVKSLRKVMVECKRVLKFGGMMFSVFPSYNMPTGSHLASVTRTPCIQWIFSAEILELAFNEIIKSRGEEAYWYKAKEEENADWKKFSGGIGINGTTLPEFKSIVRQVGFSKIHIFLPPLLSVGRTSIRYPKIKYISRILKPLLKIDFFQDYLTHRIVSILVK